MQSTLGGFPPLSATIKESRVFHRFRETVKCSSVTDHKRIADAIFEGDSEEAEKATEDLVHDLGLDLINKADAHRELDLRQNARVMR